MYLLYTNPWAEHTLAQHGPEEWQYLVSELEADTGMSIEEASRFTKIDGSYEAGYLIVEGFGEIETLHILEF